jgi:hypothetical protein
MNITKGIEGRKQQAVNSLSDDVARNLKLVALL